MSAFMWDSGKWFWLRDASAKPIPLSDATVRGLFRAEGFTKFVKPEFKLPSEYAALLTPLYSSHTHDPAYARVLMSEPRPNRASVEIQAALMSRVRG